MCGIAGFTHSRIAPDASRLRDTAERLDPGGTYATPTVTIDAARLNVSADGSMAVAFEGAVLNRAELRMELEHRGHHFHSRCDAETVSAAFREWDTGCFSKLRGMFAAAFWMESGRRLVLTRDRVGVKPFYLARHRGDLYFASEIKALFAHPEIERQLSPAGLDCFLSLNYVPCPWTLVEGVEKLPPGHWLEWRDGAVRSEAWWRLPDTPQPYWTLDAARCELDSLLKQSMREHLLADAPPGVWLNGDIHSAAILHYAASAASAPLKTFSVCASGPIRQLSSVYGARHQQIDWDPARDLLEAIQKIVHYCDDPCGEPSALPLWFLGQASGDGVALNGDGAAELFGGSPAYVAGRLAHAARRLPRALLRLASHATGGPARRFLEACQLPPEEAHVYWDGAFLEAEKPSLAGPLSGTLRRTLAELAAAGPSLPALLHFDQKYPLPDRVLAQVDRISRAHSVDARPPFLDHRIVEFAASLPARLKVAGLRRSIMLRELMRAKLPPAILRRNASPTFPADEWLRGPLRPLLVETLESGAAGHAGVFHAPAIHAFLRRHLDRRADLGGRLWGLMILFLWMKRWRIQTIPAQETALQTTPPIFTSV